MGKGALVSFALWVVLNLSGVIYGSIPTTLDGPFKPVTISLDKSFRGNAIDLPDTDPRVQRNVVGFEPEQISVSLSSTYDSVWISWITGKLQFLIQCYFEGVLLVFLILSHSWKFSLIDC